MPITVTATEGILDTRAEAQILPRLSAALLERHGLIDNAFMVRAVVGFVHILPKIFPDAMAASAVIDRLIHHGTVLQFGGESHRLRSRKAGKVE